MGGLYQPGIGGRRSACPGRPPQLQAPWHKCIFMLRDVRPFLSDKYDLTKHPNYKYTADADKKYLFDMERYMKRKPAIVKPDEPFEMYELTATDLQ